jgi:hypothetical protein
MMTDNQEALRLQLEAITLEHRDLDEVILELTQKPFVNQLQLTRLKKRKLYLKDQIERIKSKLIPDLNA